jgi:hypothetical protein
MTESTIEIKDYWSGLKLNQKYILGWDFIMPPIKHDVVI